MKLSLLYWQIKSDSTGLGSDNAMIDRFKKKVFLHHIILYDQFK